MSGYTVPPAMASGSGYRIIENAPLLGRNTLHVSANAELLIEVSEDTALEELLALPLLKRAPVLVLGEGSNVLIADNVKAVVLSMQTRGITLLGDDGEYAMVRAAAGENWNDFVHWTLAHGYSGMENLVLIPGTIGAVPIQNIGAYGTEAGEFIASVEAIDRSSGQRVRLDRADCAFGYRDSTFKQKRDRYVIVSVDFRLPRQRQLQLDYAGVREELAELGFDDPRPVHVAEAITRIRTRKLPDPHRIGNAGSFFKNPMVDPGTAARLRTEHPSLPQWPGDDGSYKVSAAAMIEAAGLKGYRDGAAGVSDQHALVLVNHGGASGSQLLSVARHVVATVRERYGIELEAEPRIVSATL